MKPRTKRFIRLPLQIRDQIEDYLYEFPRGKTLRQLFKACEKMGATVYWGLWSDSELNAIAE